MKAHQWYRVEMTATGQMYLRVELVFDAAEYPRLAQGPALRRENLGKVTCSCREGHLL
jgi:hypothetical protein